MKTIFFDVDTQLDFLFPAGALAVPGAENVVKPIMELTRFAAATGIQIISTADAHTEDDPEFKVWKPHCVKGTTGQGKAAGTLLPKQAVLGNQLGDQPGSQAADVAHAPQIIVEKQMLDCFTNPNLRPLLSVLNADRYVVYGVVSEFCVQCAAFGLLETGAIVELVSDAIKSLSARDEEQMLQRFQAAGGLLTTVEKATA